MVKKFRRSAAGLEEQLPSDLRPPPILKRTCDYLFDDMVGKARFLGDVHHFVWDRTRAIRNDFSIQQVQKREELRIAIECYERIARFHIVSLHQLALPEKPYSKYDWQQEREQLDRTLLSLMQLYDDSRDRIDLPNEAEFRAYCVIMQLQDPIPDLEDRIQSWPRQILEDRRVRKAQDVYMAACNIMDPQGPLKPRADHLIARQDWQRFWTLVASKEVSYLMACAAEVYFNLVRRTVLNALLRTSWAILKKDKDSIKTTEWTVEVLCDLLAFDDGDEVYSYCEHFGFAFKELDDGEHYLDLTSVGGTTLPQPTAGILNQSKSHLVEDKRFGRTLPAIINGLTVKQAQDAGLVAEKEYDEEMQMEDAHQEEDQYSAAINQEGSSDPFDDGESLFVPEAKKSTLSQPQAPFAFPSGAGATQATLTPFSGFGSGTGPSFGKPSAFGDNAGKSSSQQSTKAEEPSRNPPKFDFINPTKRATGTGPLFDFAGASTMTAKNTTTPKTPTFEESTGTSENIFPRPLAPSDTGPFRFPSAAAPTVTQPANLEETLSPKSNTPSLFAPAPPVASSKYDNDESPAIRSDINFLQPTGSPAQPLPSQTNRSPELKGSSQPHFTPSQPPSTSTFNPQPSTPGHNSGVRKLSSSRDHRPEKPSPLSHSFTAGEDTSAVDDHHTPQGLTTKPPPSGPFPTQDGRSIAGSASIAKTPLSLAPRSSGEDLNTLVTRIADEFYTDPIKGILKQYIDYHVRQTVREMQDQIESEQLAEEADRYNHFRLHTKYGRRWREIFWQKKLAKTGRERRERRQRRLQQRSSQEIDGGSLFDAGSSRAQSQAGFVANGEDFGVRQTVEVDMFGRSLDDQRTPQSLSATRQPRAGAKRPISSHGPEDISYAKQHSHKRMKSTSHIDERGRIAKPNMSSNANHDILKRSSFLGFSHANDGGSSKNTTKSNYFRLKALGVHRIDEAASPRGTKRRVSVSVQGSTQTSPPALRSPSQFGSPITPAYHTSLMRPPSATPARSAKIDNDDEALFARLKAARENLMDSKTFIQSEMEKEQEFRRSLKSSLSSNEFQSPSMAKARLDAKMRASHGTSELGASTNTRDVPAYRLRESKFVPREHYVKAIEKSSELRASRSLGTSRAESPQIQGPTHAQPKPASTSQLTFAMHDSIPNQTSVTISATKEPNGVSHQQPEPQLSGFVADSASTTVASRGPISFANHTTKMSSENPFMKAPAGTTFANFSPQQTFSFSAKPQHETGPHDFTVQPAKINEALSNSFGSSHGYGTNRLLSIPQDIQTPPQQNSYLQSQAISLLSHDEDDVVAPSQHPQGDSTVESEATDELYDESSDQHEFAATNGHINPYELLAHQNMDQADGESWDSDLEEEERPDENGIYGNGRYDTPPNGYVDSELEDEEGIDGDIEDDESEGIEEDEDAHGYEYSEDEDEETQRGHYPPQGYDARWAVAPPKNDALQGVGNTADQAIELDSD